MQGFRSAPERTRTSTDHKVHKALNLARLPIPPQALDAGSIALPRPLQGFSAGLWLPLERVCGSQARWIESVLSPRYSSEHMFDCLWIAERNEQGAD